MTPEFEEFYDSYELLVPQREEGIIVYFLNRKIEKNEIDRNFTYQDIQTTISEISTLTPGHQPHTERILKDLLHYFIERPPEKRDRYKLTEYANAFLKLIQNKLRNPYRHFPLRESFKQYGLFKTSEIKSINHFQSWYEQGFNVTTKQTIIDHLESLKDEVDISIRSLNSILYSTNAELRDTINRFVAAFKEFGAKAEEIRDTLRLGVKLKTQIDEVVNTFYLKVENLKHPEDEQELKQYEIEKRDFTSAALIQERVAQFFELVDEKLAQLKDRILFSSTKLTELQDNLRYQTNFKINIKNFLTHILLESKYTKEGLVLPSIFPKKSIPYQFKKFIIIRHYEFLSPVKNKIISPPTDKKYKEKERAKIDLELQRQENTVKWVNKYKQLLRDQKELDFTPRFYEILTHEKDVEIPLQVGFELFQFANRSPNEYTIQIDKELLKEFKDQSIVTWRMKILQKS